MTELAEKDILLLAWTSAEGGSLLAHAFDAT